MAYNKRCAFQGCKNMPKAGTDFCGPHTVRKVPVESISANWGRSWAYDTDDAANYVNDFMAKSRDIKPTLLKEYCDLPGDGKLIDFINTRIALRGSAPLIEYGIGKDKFWYADNNAPILFVAHIDTIPEHMRWSNYGVRLATHPKNPHAWVAVTGQLDDRLGIWIGLEAIPNHIGDIPYDILLCDNEEMGGSTAEDFAYTFAGEKKYNWIFEIDRRLKSDPKSGPSCVMYEYHSEKMVEVVGKYGFITERGSFSDICRLNEFGAKGINFSAAYLNEHTGGCHAYGYDVTDVVFLLAKFILCEMSTHYPHTPPRVRASSVASLPKGTTKLPWYDNKAQVQSYKIPNDAPLENVVVVCKDCQRRIEKDEGAAESLIEYDSIRHTDKELCHKYRIETLADTCAICEFTSISKGSVMLQFGDDFVCMYCWVKDNVKAKYITGLEVMKEDVEQDGTCDICWESPESGELVDFHGGITVCTICLAENDVTYLLDNTMMYKVDIQKCGFCENATVLLSDIGACPECQISYNNIRNGGK